MVDKSGDRVRQMFAEIAPRYDLMKHVLSLNIDRHWRSKTLRILNLKPGDRVLDTCTGTGDLAIAMSKQLGHTSKVIGSDFCAEMLEIAKKKSQKSDLSVEQVEFIEADTQKLPFDDSGFDAVTVAFGLRNVAVTETGLAEMVRVCKPGGKVAVLEFSKPTVFGLKHAYNAYFQYVLPRIGQSMSKNEHSAYRYLPESVQEFPSGEELASIMRRVGLRDIQMIQMTFGVVTLYVGSK